MAEDPAEPPTIPNPPGAANRMPRGDAGFAPRFQHLREIARGGMGRVVEAFDSKLGRTVAVKESLDESPDARARFEREVAITARLEHPSIVPLYDAGVSQQGTPFYVMRKVTGAPLDVLIRKASSLDQRLLLLPNVLAAADAVAHAHLRGVIHRDLKPSNILVGELGETVVIDWGLAKAIDETDVIGERAIAGDAAHLTFSGSVFGTPGFMAPEQVTGSATDERSDVYALGATLHYLLAAQTPFHGSTEAEVLVRTSEGTPDELDALVAGLPPDLVTIARKAMARDPAARYLDAGGFSEELRRFLGGRLVASHHYRRSQRLARWIRKHRALVAAIAIGVIAAGTIAGIALRRVFDEQARTAVALASERARSDELVIAQATGLLERDPTRAVATLHDLRVDSPRWPSLGPLLADARARGIAVGYPGHGRMAVVEFAPGPGGPQILTSGGGVARLHDLGARTSRVLAEGGAGLRAWWCGSLVMLTGRARNAATELLDPRSGATATIAWPTAVSRIYAAPGVIVLMDDQRRVASLEVDALPLAHEPIVVPGALPARWIDLSGSGRWLIVASSGRTQLFRRDAGATWAAARELPFEVTAFAFDVNEQRIVVSYTTAGVQQVVELELATGTERRRWTGATVSALVYVGTAVHVLANAGVVRLEDAGTITPVLHTTVVGVLPQDLDGALVVLDQTRHITIDGRGFRRIVRSPVELTGVAVDPRGRYLVGISNAGILAWDLTHVVPARASVPIDGVLSYVDDATLVASAHHGTARGRQVVRYRVRHAPFGIESTAELRKIAVTAELHVLAHGVVFVRDRITNRVELRIPELPLPATATELLVTDPTGILVGDDAGAIVRFAFAGGARTAVTQLPAAVSSIVASGGWLAAQAGDGSLWRRDPAGAETRSAVTGDGVKIGIALTSDGAVYVARGRELLVWRSDAPAVEATVPLEIAILRSLPGDRVAMLTRESSLYLYARATRDVRPVYHATHPLVGAGLDVSADGRIAAVRAGSGLSVIDLASGEQWSLTDGVSGGALALSPDGRYLITSNQLGDDLTLLQYDLAHPIPSLAWIEAATNALRPRTARSAIEWRF